MFVKAYICYMCVCIHIFTSILTYMVSSSARVSMEVVELLRRVLGLAKTWTSTAVSDLHFQLK